MLEENGGGGAGGYRASGYGPSPLTRFSFINFNYRDYFNNSWRWWSWSRIWSPMVLQLNGASGTDSIFSSITSAGGGGGGGLNTPLGGGPGGSGGGGGGAQSCFGSAAGGAGNTPPTDPPQGNAGGTMEFANGSNSGAGGGGGATAVGGNGNKDSGPGWTRWSRSTKYHFRT